MIQAWAIKLLGALLLVAGFWAHGYYHGKTSEQRKTAAAVAQAKDDARVEENRRYITLSKAADAAELSRQSAQRDAAAARSAADGLRRAASGFVCVPSNPASAVGGQTTSSDSGVLPVVLGELAERASRLAEASDAARNAGVLCSDYADSLVSAQHR